MINPYLYTVPEESELDRALLYEDYVAWRSRFEEPDYKVVKDDRGKTKRGNDDGGTTGRAHHGD